MRDIETEIETAKEKIMLLQSALTRMLIMHDYMMKKLITESRVTKLHYKLDKL